MAESNPFTPPMLCPYLYYNDGNAAIEFLTNAFGFKERSRHVDQDGTLRHGEVQLGNVIVMLGSPPDYKNPKQLGAVTVGMYMYVDDVDAHYEKAKAAGADIQNPPTDQTYGDRSYGVLDPEGHQWWFAQFIG
jgi:PhnB protein